MRVCAMKGQVLMAQKVSFSSLLLHLTAEQADYWDKLGQIVLTVMVTSSAFTKVCTVHKGTFCRKDLWMFCLF